MSVDEWDQRAVCPDGSCIGVIGADGQCKVCGRVAPNWGDERKRGLADTDDDDDDDDDDAGEVDGMALDAESAGDDDDDDDEDEDEEAEDAGDDASYEWSRRKLCSNGACHGVIGADNICLVCGKPAEANA